MYTYPENNFIKIELPSPRVPLLSFSLRIKDEERELRVAEKQGGNNSVTSTQTFLIPSVCRKLDTYVMPACTLQHRETWGKFAPLKPGECFSRRWFAPGPYRGRSFRFAVVALFSSKRPVL